MPWSFTDMEGFTLRRLISRCQEPGISFFFEKSRGKSLKRDFSLMKNCGISAFLDIQARRYVHLTKRKEKGSKNGVKYVEIILKNRPFFGLEIHAQPPYFQ